MDDLGLVDLRKLRENKNNADFEGKSGFCFKIDDKIIKIYAKSTDKGFAAPDTSKICDFSGLSADTIVFPEKYIYEKGRKAGEISKYIDSYSIDEAIFHPINIKKMIDSYEKVLLDFHLYSNIHMIDLCFVNILYSNKNGFHIIDTTDWQMTDNAIYRNKYNLDSSIINMFIKYLRIPYVIELGNYCVDEEFINIISKYGTPGKELIDSFNEISIDKYNFYKFMFSYLNIYRIHYNMDANRLEDVKELTKILKKG